MTVFVYNFVNLLKIDPLLLSKNVKNLKK